MTVAECIVLDVLHVGRLGNVPYQPSTSYIHVGRHLFRRVSLAASRQQPTVNFFTPRHLSIILSRLESLFT